MLELKNISVRFDGKSVLSDCSLTLGEGERIALMGPSGCGKTTLLRVALSLQPPDTGSVSGDAGRTAAVFQEPRLLPWRTAAENVNAVLSDTEATMPEALSMLDRVELSDAAEKYPAELSGGMQQRVGIASAMLLRPAVLMADEPTSALDVHVQKQVVEEMMLMRREYGVSIIIVTHNIGVVGAMADNVLVMQKGRAVEYGETDKILNHPETAYTKTLMAAVPRLERGGAHRG